MTFFAIILYIIGVIFFGYLTYISYAGVRIFWEEKNYGGVIMMLLMAVPLTIMLIYLLYTGVKGMLDNDLSTVLYIIGGVCIFLIGFFVIKRNKYRLNMSKDTLKTIGWWMFALSIIALITYAGHSCSKRQSEYRESQRIAQEKEYLQKLLTDKYIYKDINGVFHITNACGMLNDIYYTCDDEEKRGNYSSQYIIRDSVKNWHNFAATHQLCSECFSPELIRQLDSVCRNRKGRLSNPYWQKEVESEDERYRDAYEEYYNVTNPREWRR